jgi:hypothetical protein
VFVSLHRRRYETGFINDPTTTSQTLSQKASIQAAKMIVRKTADMVRPRYVGI